MHIYYKKNTHYYWNESSSMSLFLHFFVFNSYLHSPLHTFGGHCLFILQFLASWMRIQFCKMSTIQPKWWSMWTWSTHIDQGPSSGKYQFVTGWCIPRWVGRSFQWWCTPMIPLALTSEHWRQFRWTGERTIRRQLQQPRPMQWMQTRKWTGWRHWSCQRWRTNSVHIHPWSVRRWLVLTFLSGDLRCLWASCWLALQMQRKLIKI